MPATRILQYPHRTSLPQPVSPAHPAWYSSRAEAAILSKKTEVTDMLDLLNEIWTAWNQQWGATVATVIASIALITTQGQRILRLVSSVIHWRVWRTVARGYRAVRRRYRLGRAKATIRERLTRTVITIPVRTYDNCLPVGQETAGRGALEKITPKKPVWLNDYYVAQALRSLSDEGRIVKATR